MGAGARRVRGDRQVRGRRNQDLVALRIAECDYYLDRHRAARDGLKPLLKDDELEAEARFFYLSAVGELGDRKTFVSEARELVKDFPASEWAAETLNAPRLALCRHRRR